MKRVRTLSHRAQEGLIVEDERTRRQPQRRSSHLAVSPLSTPDDNDAFTRESLHSGREPMTVQRQTVSVVSTSRYVTVQRVLSFNNSLLFF